MSVDFSRTLTIEPHLFYPDRTALEQIADVIGRSSDPLVTSSEFSEPFLAWLGAEKISSLDISSFDGANIVHDLKHQIAESLGQNFSLVFDGGTLEHIFNLPAAFKNCMEMVELGGHFVQTSVVNNFAGHGFWQFRPELLFRVFSKENGFQTKALLLHEIEVGGTWYAVSDPDILKNE
ncbi:MAG: hypothetical protein ACLP0B_15985 [Steroidobacteraceae bacterium]